MPQAALDADLTEAQNRHAAAVELCREQRYAAAEPPAREAWALLGCALTPLPGPWPPSGTTSGSSSTASGGSPKPR